MKVFDIKTENGTVIQCAIADEELVYGCTGILIGNDSRGGKKNIIINNCAFHPLTHEKLQIITYGVTTKTHGTMLVPAHNEEHYRIAEKFGIPIKQVVMPVFENTGAQKIRPELPIEKRQSVIAVVKHFDKDEYLCVDSINRVNRSFVLGGCERNETPEEAALREITEETGYMNVKVNNVHPIKTLTKFFADYKGVNRHSTLSTVFCDLIDESRSLISEKESSEHNVVWVPKSKLQSFLTINNNQFVTNMIMSGNLAYEGDGLMVNSGNLDGLTRAEAKAKLRKNRRV